MDDGASLVSQSSYKGKLIHDASAAAAAAAATALSPPDGQRHTTWQKFSCLMQLTFGFRLIMVKFYSQYCGLCWNRRMSELRENLRRNLSVAFFADSVALPGGQYFRTRTIHEMVTCPMLLTEQQPQCRNSATQTERPKVPWLMVSQHLDARYLTYSTRKG